MKIVLVHPAPKIWTRAALVPLGLGYIAAYLEKNGFSDIEVIDYNVEAKSHLPKADIIGITATTPLIKSAWKIAKKAKKIGAITVIGGPHVSALPQESARLPFVDFVVIGEGEETMLELCRAIETKHGDFEKIKGLVFKKGKQIISSLPRPFISDLDRLPFPAHHLFKLPLYTSTQPLVSIRKPAVGILTSRGCPFGCNFCYKGTFGRVWRARSVANVLSEWEYLIKGLKVAEIALMDDGFNTDIGRAIKICQEIKRRGLAIPWRAHNGIRADLASYELLLAMKQSGCYYVAFGVESGSQRVLDEIIGKNIKLFQVKKAFRIARRLGLLTTAFFVLGNPGEKEEEIQQTVKFAQKIDPDFAQFCVATPFPGTALYQTVLKNAKIKIKNWDNYSQFDQKGFFDWEDLKADRVGQLAREAWRAFYLRPGPILRILKRRETWLNLPNVIAGGAHYLLQRDI